MSAPGRLGKYEIAEVLGTGATGVVCKGFDPGIHRIVAIKTIRRAHARRPPRRRPGHGRSARARAG
jgi:serine/threonine protein kinase